MFTETLNETLSEVQVLTLGVLEDLVELIRQSDMKAHELQLQIDSLYEELTILKSGVSLDVAGNKTYKNEMQRKAAIQVLLDEHEEKYKLNKKLNELTYQKTESEVYNRSLQNKFKVYLLKAQMLANR